ncbi:MAG: TolC family protein [Verrucomicrobia bacterium]|nr:TolC family protein [Verrucomicrobiota bacterium]
MNHPFCFHSFFIIAFLPVMPLAASSFAGQSPLSLEDVTKKTLAQNPVVAAARARWRMATKRIPQAAAWEDPKLNFRSLLARFVQIPANGFTDQAVSLEQSIPISGKNRSRERAAIAEAVAAFQDLRRQELEIILKARSAFIQLLNDYELLDLNQAEETALSQTIDNTTTKFEVGAKRESDVVTAQIERQKVTEQRQDLQRKRSNDETTLKVLMKMDAFAPLPRPGMQKIRAVPLDARELRSRIVLNNPDVLQANAELAAAESRYQLAKREWIPDPTVSIQADHYNAGSQIASEVSGGISISLPWFNERKYSAGEREALDRVTAAQNALEISKNEAFGKVRDQLQKIETLHHHADLYGNTLIPSAKENVSANQSDYEANKTTFENVLSSQRNLWEIEAAYHQHLTDYQIALAELESVVGSDLGFFGVTGGLSK